MNHVTVFPTRIGPIALVWRATTSALTHVELPAHADERAELVAARVASRASSPSVAEPPHGIAQIVASITRHFEGSLVTFGDVTVDLDRAPPFHRRVYEALRRVPPGKTVTYGELAALAGSPGASRAVGQAMAKNPCPLIVPCHRVLAANGATGGFSSAGGAAVKVAMLAIEGIDVQRTGG
jgi:methylated-DNA-[protein]-cysteine S-methyltransferase